MKNQTVTFFFAFIIFGCFSTTLRCQYMWHLTHTDFDGRYYYAFNSLSCTGDNCTAGGTLIDGVNHVITRMLWRSYDGGRTWEMQNPGLPSYTDLLTKHYLSAIQQIDSLNVIAGGDSGYVVHTFDGGKTWQRQQWNPIGYVRVIHFADSLAGIILAQESDGFAIGGGKITIHTTSDGGRHWMNSPFTQYDPNMSGDFASCHSYGNGKFRVFKNYLGPVYTTYNNWQTIDSTGLLPDHAQEDSIYYGYIFEQCNFMGGDTAIAYGYYYDTANYVKSGGLIIRSLDAGGSWEKPIKISNDGGIIRSMSSNEADTILAGITSINKIVMSIDRGKSWRLDSLILDTNYITYSPIDIAFTNGGHPLAVFPNSSYGPSIIIRGDRMIDRVEQIDFPTFKPHVYPNPVSGVLNLIALEALRPIHIVDIFGREVIQSSTSEQGTMSINVSSLTPGIYEVLIDHNGRSLNAGKVVVIGR